MNRHLNNFLDKVEGKPEGFSNANIDKERKRQGYDKKHEVAKKMRQAIDEHHKSGSHKSAIDAINSPTFSKVHKSIKDYKKQAWAEAKKMKHSPHGLVRMAKFDNAHDLAMNHLKGKGYKS